MCWCRSRHVSHSGELTNINLFCLLSSCLLLGEEGGEVARGQILTAVRVMRPMRKNVTRYVPGLHSQLKAQEIAGFA